jgi:hypothetical protein
MRRFAVLALLALAGCGVAPESESAQAIIGGPLLATGGSACPYGGTFLPSYDFEKYNASVDPWGSNIGVVVAYPDGTGNYTVYGVDYPYTQPFWFMRNVTDSGLAQLWGDPQTRRDCGGGQGNPGGGSAPKSSPPPCTLSGVCLPTTIATDATNSFRFGPFGTTNTLLCQAHGGGGCVPLGCSAFYPTCGTHADGCGGNIYCGACRTCPCGGTYPRCYTCGTF